MAKHPLIIDVDALPEHGQEVSLFLSAGEVAARLQEWGSGAVDVLTPLAGEARIQPSGGDVFVSGSIGARVRVRCVRCLEPFEHRVEETFHLTFVEDFHLPPGEHELHPEDLDLVPLAERTVDLARTALEQLLLGLPAHPVCREDCAGLCPRCGANRNLESCNCREKAPDPRWEALARWRPKRSAG